MDEKIPAEPQDNCPLAGEMQSTSPNESDFVIKYPEWPANTWVRQEQNDYSQVGEGGWYFSPKLMPILNHPLVVERGPDFARELSLHRFFTYAGFTAVLERYAVNPALLLIAEEQTGLDFSQRYIRAADEIYTEEAFHAQESNHIIDKLAEMSKIQPLKAGTPNFLLELNQLSADLPTAEKEQVMLGFATVSETLISSILSYIPRDQSVVKGIREYVNDHALDEGRHHKYFSEFLTQFWPGLGDEGRAFLGPLFPKFFRWFLEPDHTPLRRTLLSYGMSQREVDRVIIDSYNESEVLASIRSAAKRSLVTFNACGALEDPRVVDAFAKEGLL